MTEEPLDAIESQHDLRVLIANEEPERLAVITQILTSLLSVQEIPTNLRAPNAVAQRPQTRRPVMKRKSTGKGDCRVLPKSW